MVICQTEREREDAIRENNLELSYTEKRIWDMWRRWRMSNKTLWPWQYMTNNNIVYADDMIDLECMESIVSKLERTQEEYESRRSQNKARKGMV